MKLVKYSPRTSIVGLKKVNTVSLCFNSDTPSLAELKKDNGEDKVLSLLEIWILDINDFFNVNNKMKPGQIKETAIMVLQDFYYLKIADLNFVFTNAKKGKYGNLYGSLDGSKIYQWFSEHDNERAGVVYRERLKEHDIIKSNE